MKKIYKIFIILIIAALLSIFSVYYVFFKANFIKPADQTYFDIPKNTDFKSLVEQLSPYLKSKQSFIWASKLKRFSKPKSGRYKLRNKMSNNALINTFRIGQRIEVKLTFNNQNSPEALAGTVAKQFAFDSLSLLKVMQDENFLHKNGFNKENLLLMYLPNTYHLYYNTTPEQFRDKMLAEYRKFWNEKRKELAKKQNLTPVQASILASIIQKESNIAAELPVIAGVYLNRLKKGMLLQADPTVVYAYRQKYGKDLIIKRVLNKHKAVDSPYNTYMYVGLPPGPICMPDIRSIKAVLNPKNHHYYYFVADFNRPGYHIFSKTLSQHNQAVRSYHTDLNRNRIYH